MTESSCKEVFKTFMKCGGTLDCDYLNKKCSYFNKNIPEEKLIKKSWFSISYYLPYFFPNTPEPNILYCNIKPKDNEFREKMNTLLWYSAINPGCNMKEYFQPELGKQRIKELNQEFLRIVHHNYQEEDSTRCILWQNDPFSREPTTPS